MLDKRLLLATMIAVTPMAAQGAPARPIVLGKGDAARIVPAKVREPLVIRLESNPSTGYAWRVLRQVNVTVAQPIRTKRAPSTPAGLVGAPEIASIQVTPLRRGNASLVLAYGPAYDQKAKPEQTLRFHFSAK